MNKKIYLASPHMSDEGYEQEYVKEAFDTNWIAPLGENVNKFEEELASYVGTKYAAALSAGTAAIHMAFKALDVKEGDIVFCSSLTFSATANPITYQNATPVFIDSEPETWNMDPKALEKAFESYPVPASHCFSEALPENFRIYSSISHRKMPPQSHFPDSRYVYSGSAA